jgi:hypothetical protein
MVWVFVYFLTEVKKNCFNRFIIQLMTGIMDENSRTKT